MGTLKLSNIKNAGHLKASISYIIKEEKTGGGQYIFGNSGFSVEMIQETFRETKRSWEKEWGRQAYHYILTFAEEDEVTPALVQEITEQVMTALFPDDAYDWAGAVHLDTEHLHSHILFNSVNRITGYKYRYEKGDWEEQIQKIVDQTCKRYGFRTIAYTWTPDGKPEKKNKTPHIASNYEKHNLKVKRTADLIRQDLDYYITKAGSMEELMDLMKQDGYRIRKGNSKKYGTYLTFTPYGMERGIRSYRLGEAYSFEQLIQRIQAHEKTHRKEPDVRTYQTIIRISRLPAFTMRRQYAKYLFIARRWKNQKPFPNSFRYKQAVIETEKMLEEYNLVKKMGFQKKEEVEAFLSMTRSELRQLYQRKESGIDTAKMPLLKAEIRRQMIQKKTAKRVLQRIDTFSDVEEKLRKKERRNDGPAQ